jgi:hypothetical protein
VPRSCYVLELSVTPGRTRRADLFTYNRLVHIRRCLEHEFLGLEPAGRADAALLAAQGETIALWVVEENRAVRGIDLRPHIRVRLGADAPIALADAGVRNEAYRKRLASSQDVAFEIDWDAIALETPALRGELLHPGEILELDADEDVLAPFDSYLEIAEDLAYGYEDLEGDRRAPPGFTDPDPER